MQVNGYTKMDIPGRREQGRPRKGEEKNITRGDMKQTGRISPGRKAWKKANHRTVVEKGGDRIITTIVETLSFLLILIFFWGV